MTAGVEAAAPRRFVTAIGGLLGLATVGSRLARHSVPAGMAP